MREDGITAIESKDDYVAFKFNLHLKDGHIPCTRIVSKKRAFSSCSICGAPVSRGKPMCEGCYWWLREGR